MSDVKAVYRRQLILTTVISIAAAILAGLIFTTDEWAAWYEIVGFSIAACLLGSRTISISRSMGTVSVGFIFVFATAVGLGPAEAIIAGAASVLGATVLSPLMSRPKRAPAALVVITNVAIISLAAGVSGWCYGQLSGLYETIGISTGVLAAFIVIGIYYVINSMGMAVMASADGKRTVGAIWSENLYWTVLPYYVGGAAAVVVHALAAAVGPYVWLAIIPPTLLIHVGLDHRARARFAQHVDERELDTLL